MKGRVFAKQGFSPEGYMSMENKHLSGNRQPSPELFHPGSECPELGDFIKWMSFMLVCESVMV